MGVVHIVRQGECFSIIARRYGFQSYRTLYDHPDNAELKQERPNPNVLFPGDRVVIPDKETRTVNAATAKRHKFVVRTHEKVLRLRIEDHDGEPIAGAAYELAVGTDTRKGSTDGDGRLEEKIPSGTGIATLKVAERTLKLRLGAVNPMKGAPDKGLSGVYARLRNLGYRPFEEGEVGPRTRLAIAVFQADAQLPVNGKLDDATRAKLEKLHGS
jgi:hypothetical protein